MNGHTIPPLDFLVSDGIEKSRTPKPGKAVQGACTPPAPQDQAVMLTEAKSIGGVYVETSGMTLHIYAAMQQGLLPPGLGLALLEAQAATGGLVDPVEGRLFSVAEALCQGLVGLELKEKLLAAEGAVTGYPDPYGGDRLPLFQAIRKEVVDKVLGMSWLEVQLATGGLVDPAQGMRMAPEPACQLGLLDQETRRHLEQEEPEPDITRFCDPNTLEQLSYRQLLARCVQASSTGLALLPLRTTFRSLGRAVSTAELLEAGILDGDTARGLQEGRLAVADVSARADVQRYLQGTESVAGVVLLPTGHKKSLYQAATEHLLPVGMAVALLEAQAATHTLVDLVTGQQLWVDEAIRAGLVGPELYGQLLVAEQAVTGFRDPFSGSHVTLFQAMQKGLVDEPLAMRLLDVQMTTGGLVCPARRLRLPLDVALRSGFLDEDTRQRLSETTGFLDPSTQESLSYGQLLAHCVTDPKTGLAFLPLTAGAQEEEPQGPLFITHRTRQALSAAMATIPVGKLQGRPASVWQLLFSDAVPAKTRASLAQQHQEGTLSVEALASQLQAAIKQATTEAKVCFMGLRDTVTPGELLEATIIDREVYEQLEHGQATAREVGQLEVVQRYLQGTGCLAGLLLPDSRERLSIYEARSKGLLRPGTALVLLEAQAATGFVIDPVANRRLSVEEAVAEGVVGGEVREKLLSAERAVTGYTDPYTGEQISLFQAMQKDLIVRDHGLRLLEAQIATGGIIDPVHSHRVPVEVAYQRGYFDRVLNLVLSDPGDDTKGFFDPNTHENLTYLQLLGRCVEDPETGLRLLPLSSSRPQLVDSATRRALQGRLLTVQHGRFRGQRICLWDLLNSEYVCEGQRRQLLRQFQQHRVTLEHIASVLQVASRRWEDLSLPTLRGQIPAHELLEAGVIDETLLDRVLSGAMSPKALLEVDAVRTCLFGSGSLGGVLLRPSGRRLSLYQAMQQKLLGPGLGLALLEAQAATGALLDPHSQEMLTVDEAVHRGLVGPELYAQLRLAEAAVTGFRDPFSGKTVSIFQAMKKGLVPAEHVMRLLEAQVATGGAIDPRGHHHLPTPVAIQRGCIDQETQAELSGGPQTFPSPDGQGLTSYAQLLEQCPRDQASGLPLLLLPDTGPALPSDEQVAEVLRAAPGAEDGRSLWDVLSSHHFTEEQRRAFKERFREGHCSEPQLREALLSWLRGAELRARARVSLPGPRGQVPAVWLLDVGIISQDTLEALVEGQQSPEEVAMQPEVKACLWGTGCVAGVLLQPSGAKATVARAMQDDLLPVGLAQRLLEAQVACGALVNPMTNQRLSVEEAVKFGLVAGELSDQLRHIEKVVAGFRDPCSGRILSLWQAMEQGLVSRAEGLPLLQAQLATGGALEPVHQVHLPLPTACQLGLLDEATGQVLSTSSEGVRFFFDPSAQEKVTYQELRARCIQEAPTGLWLLPLPQDRTLDVDEHTAVALRAMKVLVGAGRFGGQAVSLWDLLHSEYVDPQQRGELAALCRSGRATALHQVVQAVTALVKVAETQPSPAPFPGLRRHVSAAELFRSQLIDKRTLDELIQGQKTVQEVTQMANVQHFLKGSNFIAGVRVQATGEIMSIAEAQHRHLLRPDTALVLLEAQAATGFIIDPVKNQKLTVEQAYLAGMFSKETYEKLLSAERAVTGYTDPYSGEQISLFQAMQKDLIVRDHGLRLLEAQIATGGIIDPVHSHRVPVEVAYQRGYFDEDLSRVLEDPSDDTKGFFDPNTHENLTYLQLLGRCVEDPDTGLYLLQIVGKVEAYIYIDEATRRQLESQNIKLHVGRFAGQVTSLWDMLSSQYFTEDRRRALVQEYKTKRLSLEQLREMVVATVEEIEEQSRAVEVMGPQGPVTLAELFNSGLMEKKTLDMLQRERDSEQSRRELARVRHFLEGHGYIAGVTIPSTQEILGFYEASRKGLISMGTALQLLQAQAATGFILDPRGHQKLPVSKAVAAGLVGTELQDKLFWAEKAASGHTDPASGARLSLFQAMQQKLVPPEEALRLLEVQVATGGVIDPVHGHRVPLKTAFQRGLLNQDMYPLVSDQTLMRKRFVDPRTQAAVTYHQLQMQCRTDAATGWALLPVGLGAEAYEYIDEATRQALEDEGVDITVGRYRGQRWSVWQLLNSEYVTEEQKQDLVQRYKQDTAHALQEVVQLILKLVEDKEQAGTQWWFQGIRRQITASELVAANVLTEKDMEALAEGRNTVDDLLKKDTVQRYLQGTSCIAGVLVPRKDAAGGQEKMSIYQAMWKGVLRPGTALVLLEAQAATGFVIDPVANRRLSVEEAVAEGVVGGEVREKLLSAERAVTGYTDPYSGEQISLFQAMQKDLIVRDHGLRLLEAQIATGGIIDPVHSHRVPVEVAYQRGYFDEDLSRVLEDPGDDTKGFFDPNTHENLTYLQLLGRCVEDPDTGLLFLCLSNYEKQPLGKCFVKRCEAVREVVAAGGRRRSPETLRSERREAPAGAPAHCCRRSAGPTRLIGSEASSLHRRPRPRESGSGVLWVELGARTGPDQGSRRTEGFRGEVGAEP
ncbi:PREDICTED: epiplakin [Elephantulus edwardii]|uniref:epiplakin n=1 Tax=Elephantulus edwardii TaxID=28737 RepID=UPI0003F0ACA1|nr:PREDICTED: epiplakin [Elephantulus edwardii]